MQTQISHLPFYRVPFKIGGVGWTITSLFLLGILLIHSKNIQKNTDVGSLQVLREIYLRDGMPAFSRAKAELQDRVAQILQVGENHPAFHSAYNTAVFLFPELLDENNFEKDVALTFGGLQKVIESRPHTVNSYLIFEQMRSSILNYEKPNGKASRHVQEVLALYETLARP